MTPPHDSPKPADPARRFSPWPFAVVAIAGIAAIVVWALLRAPASLLRPTVVERLETSLSGMAGRDEAFLVAYAFSTRTSADATKSYFLGDLAVGSSQVHASWKYSVDFGVDLQEIGDFAGSIACDESARTCTWTLPPPSHRPPAIDSESIRLATSGSLLVTDGLEQGHRDEVLRQLSVLTREEIRRPEFQQLVRENVRAGLERLARELLAAPGVGPVEVRVVFRDAAGAPERAAPGVVLPAPEGSRDR